MAPRLRSASVPSPPPDPPGPSKSSRSRLIRSASGSRNTMPSSACMTCASMPYRSARRAGRAAAPGWLPRGSGASRGGGGGGGGGPRGGAPRPRGGGAPPPPPVAQLVPETLDEDRAVVGDVAAGPPLFVEVGEDVAGRPGVQT